MTGKDETGGARRPPHVDDSYLELSFKVAREFAGWRADRFVAHKIPRLSRTRVQRILRRFAFDEDGRPVKPNRALREGEIVIDLYVTVEYGTRIASVARSAMNLVKYTVEKALGFPVAEVNIHVEGLRISDMD